MQRLRPNVRSVIPVLFCVIRVARSPAIAVKEPHFSPGLCMFVCFHFIV